MTVITAQYEKSLPSSENQHGIQIYRLPCLVLPQMSIAHNFKWMSFTFTPRNVRRIFNILSDKKVEILHLNGHIFDLALSSVLARLRLSIPLVLTIHAAVQHPDPKFGAILKALDCHFVRRFVVRFCDEITVPDTNYQKYVAERYHRQDVHLVPYGMDFPIEAPNLNEQSREKFTAGAAPLIVSLGHVHEIRDRCDLIKAMPYVLDKYPRALLLIIGEVYTRKPVQLVDSLGLRHAVSFTGALPHETALGLVKIADIEAHWARKGIAGLGIASLEAMALEKPVLAFAKSDLIGSVEIENWKHLVIPPRDNPGKIANILIRLIADKALRRQIGEHAKNFVQANYSWQAVCERMEAVYHDMLSQKSTTGSRE